jgi:XRE family transcriptional regulator, aerobic/anaerobic benzoate catabolism transcriptional regulator
VAKNGSKRNKREAATGLDTSAFLSVLGERLRTMRTRRGMSRKVLARHSDISERYLAQLEAGEANCSIVLLRRIAKAIGMQLTELVDARPDRPLEAVLLEQFLGRLSATQIAEARALLIDRFEGKISERRNARIALVGLRGAGKSTLGQMLAEQMQVPFLELDRIVEQQSGMSIGECLEMFGQETFRRNERATLETTLANHPAFVMATGGGIVAEPATYELLLTFCLTVWVRASPEEHMQRVMRQGDLRPMANSAGAMDDLIAILRSREPLYAKADIVLDTAGKTPRQSVDELVNLLGLPNVKLARRTL